MVVSDSGHLWLASGFKYNTSLAGMGLCRHDGTSWKVYNDSNSQFPDSKAFCVAMQENRYVWSGTSQGLARLDLSTGSFTVYSTSNTPAFASDIIYSLHFHSNVLWIGTAEGILKYDGTNFTHYDSSLWGGSGIVYSITTDKNNVVWAGTTGGLVKYNQGNWARFDRQNSGIGSDTVYQVACDSKNDVWLATNESADLGTLCRFSGGSFHPVWEDGACNTRHLPRTSLKSFTISYDDELFFPGERYFFDQGDVSLMHHYKGGKLRTFHFTGNKVSVGTNLSIGPVVNVYHYAAKYRSVFVASGSTGDSIYVFTPDSYTSPVLPPPATWEEINRNKIRLSVQNNGTIGALGHQFEPLSEFPKGECKTSLYSANLWLGGIHANDSVRTACGTYGFYETDFWPGTLDTTDGTFDSSGNASTDLNHMWRVNQTEIDRFVDAWNDGSVTNGSYAIPPDFITWPGHGTGNSTRQLAPYFDRNQDGAYDPYDGDHPVIKGDEMLYWIMNDATFHGQTWGLPLGVEIHGRAYVYSCDSVPDTDSMAAINHTVYFNYRIFNRSNSDYRDFIAGIWVDGDLGNYADDYVGCDTVDNYGFFYNGDNTDEGLQGYGENPPMFSTVMLSEKMNVFAPYHNDFSVWGNPTVEDHYYGYMRGIWRDGSPFTDSGHGYQAGNPTRYLFSGDPYDSTQWNEANGSSVYNQPGDRRMLLTTTPALLPAKGMKELDFAFVYSRDQSAPNGRNTSWALNQQYVRQAKTQYNTPSYFQSCEPQIPTSFWPVLTPETEIGFYPNPAGNSGTLEINSPQSDLLTITVFDMNGKRVAIQQDVELLSGTNTLPVDLSRLNNGFYIIRLENADNTLRRSVKIVVQK